MIPDIKELNFPKIDGKQYASLTQATASLADMGEKTITTQIKIDGEIVPDFSFDWEVEFQGEKYIMPLRIPQGAKENTSLNSTIDLTFQHWAIYQLKRWPFVTIQQIAAGTYLPDEEEATVQLNLKDFCILFGQVLEYYYGGAITIDFNDDPVTGWQYKQEATIITISHTKIWNVLIDAFHDKYGVRWEIKPTAENSNTVKGGERYVIRVGYPTTEVNHIFEYGFEGGLLKVERQVQSEEIRNMLKGRGGETNIPLRYFKDTDPNNPDFRPDPDWVEELANIPFMRLMGATFRSYIQGWKAAHISKYPGYTAVGENNAYAPWAYRKGYTDTKFQPVEFVADEITISPTANDKQEEILPGYAPYVKKGSSLDKYGPIPDTLDNNDDIYPTLQGTGLDIAVAVEQIESDDVEESAESDAQIKGVEGVSITREVGANGRVSVSVWGNYFTIPSGMYGNFDDGEKVLTLSAETEIRVAIPGTWRRERVTITTPVENKGDVVIEDAIIFIVDADGNERSASGIPEGTYRYRIVYNIHNGTNGKLNVSVSCESPKITYASIDADKWRNTFDIWVKNVWGTSKSLYETDAQYSERVWKPVLGDREGNSAKVVFTSGDLAMSEDYEFTIVDFPEPTLTPESIKEWTDKNGVNHTSHWRITLAKSDAELEATGLYVPSTQKQGKAGDKFVFIGTEMTHVPYVVSAEIRLDDWKKDQFGEVKEIKPTAVVTTDRVRLNNEGKPDALINQLRVGNSLRLFDRRFFNEPGKAYETLYLQSITYTYREPTSEDAALNPDVEIVLGNEYTTSANPVSMMQGEISALQKQVGSISNIQQIVRAVGDRLYLRKDGISDRSLSPTQFFSLLTSGDFRAGIVGGAGWGFFKDENGNWVLEADRVNVRQEMAVNTLVINQASARGGMDIDTAAFMECTRVIEIDNGYVCYFDQKNGTVANLFQKDDIGFCNRWDAENNVMKFYKRRIVEVGVDCITLTKPLDGELRPSDWPDSGVNGSGVPEIGDTIIHFGSYTNAERRDVKIRDVVGGGYERYVEGLDSVNADGTEFYFVGRQSGVNEGRPRWFVGGTDSYIEYKNGKFTLKNVSLSVDSTVGDKNIETYVADRLGLGVTNIVLESDRELRIGRVSSSTEAVYSLSENIRNGETYTVSMWGDLPTFPATIYVYLYNGARFVQRVALQNDENALWRMTFKASGTANNIKFFKNSTDDFKAMKVKIERGMVGTDWSVSPDDTSSALAGFDYLRAALNESTTVSGGLIVASLMQLGYSIDGGFVVKSGINGVYDESKTGGGIALWAGGRMLDAAEMDPDSPSGSAASSLIRMNGTGYVANNTVRFEQDRVLLGDSLVVSDEGLEMVTANGVALSIKDAPTGYSTLNNIYNETDYPINKVVEIVNVYYSPTSQSSYLCSTFSTQRVDIGALQSGASITTNVKIQTAIDFGPALVPGLGVPKRNMGRLNVELREKTSGETQLLNGGTWVETENNNGVVKYAIDISNVSTVKKDGNYWLEIYAYDVYAENGWTESSMAGGSATLTGKATVNGSDLRRLTVGNDGFAANWGKALLCCDEDGTIMRFGNRYIRIYDGGIRINRNDGKGEVAL